MHFRQKTKRVSRRRLTLFSVQCSGLDPVCRQWEREIAADWTFAKIAMVIYLLSFFLLV